MKTAIIYYSYSGNTKEVAGFLKEYLAQRSSIEMFEIKAKESDKFLVQAMRAFKHGRAEIEPIKFDLSDYDLICLGSPVWAFAPAPAMNTYLDRCWGIENKEVVLFCTYGSGAGKERCLNYMQNILVKKGVKSFERLAIQQFKVKDKDYVIAKIKQIL